LENPAGSIRKKRIRKKEKKKKTAAKFHRFVVEYK